MKETKKASPTNAELEILDILWRKKKATVREVYDIISENKKCAYTTTLKIMQKMTAKKLVSREIEDLVHVYYPSVEEAKIRNNSVLEVINKFFKGSYSKLALHALGKSSSDENIDELLDLVNKLKQTKK